MTDPHRRVWITGIGVVTAAGIGLEGFRRLLNDPRVAGVPVVLETPKEGEMDSVNLAALRAVVDGGELPAGS